MNGVSANWKMVLERELKSARTNVWVIVVCILVLFLIVMGGLLRAQDLAMEARNKSLEASTYVRAVDREMDANKREREAAVKTLQADNRRLMQAIRELKKERR